MNNQSSIFLKREDKIKVLGGIRYASNSLSSKRQNLKYERPFLLSRNHFKQKMISGFQDFELRTDKIERTTKYSSPPSPQIKSPKISRFKLCTSKNVCVFSNLKKVETQELPQQSFSVRRDLKVNLTNSRNSTRNSAQNQKLSYQIKRSPQKDICSGSSKKFKMRKISSSLNFKSKAQSQQKIFDRWDNQDMRQDHDIIFYK